MGRQADDITGRRFGRLVAIEPTDRRVHGKIMWRCRCDCGKEVYVARANLLSGNSTSCGCRWRENLEPLYVGGSMPCNLKNTLPSDNSSGVRGVHFWKTRGMWQAYINFRGKRYNLGTYHKFEDAVAARKQAENAVWGEFLEWYRENYEHDE